MYIVMFCGKDINIDTIRHCMHLVHVSQQHTLSNGFLDCVINGNITYNGLMVLLCSLRAQVCIIGWQALERRSPVHRVLLNSGSTRGSKQRA